MTLNMLLMLDPSHGALLRVLGTIERRGWVVRDMTMRSTDCEERAVRILAQRKALHAGSAETLVRHLAKLICVREVAQETQTQPLAAAAVTALGNRTSSGTQSQHYAIGAVR
ncbi:hypothetical protein JCM17844_01690 [Iodidimonas gelatinilytica]|uniref:Uncharacterized protein n=1 Tax=Iodidimonas gelatinilytica TaxID=1236966 RepID=A0A5A7MKI5_9PROT|nr:ACT domain-containing protein [Iodidimonas gelatinilytica]GEQ96532.1 hypothetical protein JCM17844_01690 [Iodidimonas gelatinilytica]